MSNPRIFLNYRREDTRGYAGRLYDRLSHRFDEDQILRDVDAISPGIDYVEQIDQLVRQCDLMLVLIGGTWLSAQGPGGQRRLDEPGDLVSLEIATALERGIPVIPVLIQGARMPDEDELPDRIRTLARRNALEMSDSHWNHDYHRLTWAIEELTKRPLPGDHSEQPASPSGEQASPAGEGAPDSSDQGVATTHKEPTAEPALPAPRKGELMAGREPEWARCGHDDCIGVRLPTKALCLAHAADQAPDTFDAELRRIRVEGTVDARGVVVTTQLLEQLLAAVPHEDGDRPAFKAAQFNRATFQGEARFSKTTFKDYAFFEQATFESAVWFDEATFEKTILFAGAKFKDYASFYRTTFKGTGWFSRATFEDVAQFEGATFKDRAVFNEATFKGEAAFRGTTFEAEARFDMATFEAAREFGPVRARRQLVFDAATFKQRARIEAAADTLNARGALFPAGVQLRLRWAQVVLDDADLAAPSILSGAPPFHDLDEQLVSENLTRQPATSGHDRARPRLLSLRRADVAGLTVSNVDLRACRFLGAHNLDKLRIEGEGSFSANARPTGTDAGPHGTFAWGWTTRQAIAEEQHWHAEQMSPARREGWHESAAAPPAWLEDVEVPTPPQLAGLYRALRKGREDNRDEPGAADFYYGEMEMRRLAKQQQARRKRQERDWGEWAAARTEHAVLWLYWLFSGYALRASRAVLGWVLLVLLGAVAFASFGFKPPASPQVVPVGVSSLGQAVYQEQDVPRQSSWEQFPEALAFSAESTVSLLRAPDRSLTLPGRWMQMLLRVLGPLLFGLFVLSLRGRVRR